MRTNRLSPLAKRWLTAAGCGLWLGIALTFGASVPATAQIDPVQACQGDAFRLCNDFIPDRAKVGACLRRNGRSLSKDCRTVVFGGGGTRPATHRVYHRKYYRHY